MPFVQLDDNDVPTQWWPADPGGSYGAVEVTDEEATTLLSQPPGVLTYVPGVDPTPGVIALADEFFGPSSSAPIEAMTGTVPPY